MEAAPTLFRSLERPGAALSMETAVLAAVAAYTALARPAGQQTAELSSLILSTWPQLSGAAKKDIVQALRSHPNLPQAVMELLADTTTVPGGNDTPSPMLGRVRKTLLSLAPSADTTGLSDNPLLAGVAAAALRGDVPAAEAAIAKAYGLSAERRAALAADAAGTLLAQALKGLHATPGDALGILMALRPDLARDMPALDRMGRYYRALDEQACRKALASGPAGFGQLREPSADATARTHFGRRTVKPPYRVSFP